MIFAATSTLRRQLPRLPKVSQFSATFINICMNAFIFAPTTNAPSNKHNNSFFSDIFHILLATFLYQRIFSTRRAAATLK